MPRKPRITDPNDPMAVLARIALEEQAEKAAERENKKRSKAVALAQHREQEADAGRKAARFQAVCDHLLGNHRIGVIPERRRCALHKDYLSDKSVRIYCGKCRFDWHPGDRAEFIVRIHGLGPKRLPNPTKKGWREINEFFYSFENSKDLTSRAFRIERVEPEQFDDEAESVPAA